MEITTNSLRKRVIDMKVGDNIVVPCSAYGQTTIRCYASEIGFAMNRIYAVRRNRIDRTYTIIRTA